MLRYAAAAAAFLALLVMKGGQVTVDVAFWVGLVALAFGFADRLAAESARLALRGSSLLLAAAAIWSQPFDVPAWLALVEALAFAHLAWRSRDDEPRRATAFGALAGFFLAEAIGLYFHFKLKSEIVNGLKAAIALAATAASLYEGGRAAEKRRVPGRFVRAVAAGFAAMSVVAYVNFGDLGYSQFYHRWEFFHYFMGSKYDHELGYELLYKCTAIAQADLGQGAEVKARKLRELAEDQLEPTQPTLDHPEVCKSRFTPERWESFKADVKWFRSSSNLQYWNDMQKDHGYNPPPVWSIAGHLLSSVAPASDGTLKVLAAIDPLFFIGMFAAVGWAFGPRVLAVALTFWGCQEPATYFWTGGAFLRQDWIFWLVVSACLTRKRKLFSAGAAFAYSTLLRVFPGPFLAGWLVVAGAHFVKHRRLHRDHLRVALGGVVATCVLVSASVAVSGKDAYPGFVRHIQTHMNTPLTNHMGLRTVLSHGSEGRMKLVRDETALDPFGKWKQMRRERFGKLKPLYYASLLALGAAFVVVVRRVKSLWIAQALAVALVVATTELTCYYYSMFLLAALLSRVRREFEYAALFVAGLSQVLITNRFISYYYDDRYTAQSVLFLAYAVGLVLAFWPRPKATAAAKPTTTVGGDAAKPIDAPVATGGASRVGDGDAIEALAW